MAGWTRGRCAFDFFLFLIAWLITGVAFGVEVVRRGMGPWAYFFLGACAIFVVFWCATVAKWLSYESDRRRRGPDCRHDA